MRGERIWEKLEMSKLPSVENNHLASDWNENELVERIWRELGGHYSQQHIRRTVQEIGSRFQEVRVKQFVPIFIHREVVDLLGATLPQSLKV